MSRRRTCVALAWLALACAASPATARAAPAVDTSAEAALARAEAEFASHLLAARPDLALRYGVRGATDPLSPFADDAIARSGRWLEGFLPRVRAIDRARLSERLVQRADSLEARVVRAAEESGPAGALHVRTAPWFTRVLAAVRAPFDSSGARGCEPVRTATLRLRAVPEFLRAVALTLSGRTQESSDELSALAASALDTLRTALPVRARSCRDPQRVADFVVADTLAARAIEGLPGMLAPGTAGRAP